MPNKITQVDLYPIIEQERPYLFQITGPRGGMRAYQKPGSDMPLWSVTSVLSNTVAKPNLYGWHNRMGREAIAEFLEPVIGQTLTKQHLGTAIEEAKMRPSRTSGQAADLGNRAHDLLSEYITSRIEKTDIAVEVPEDLQTVWDSFQQWEEDAGIDQYYKTEFAVYSESFKYAGSVDALARNREGRWMVIDWKTSKDLYPEHAMQVAAYANALSFPIMVRSEADPTTWSTWDMIEPWVIRLGKTNAECDPRRVTNPQHALDGVLNAMQMWYALGLPTITSKAKEELEEHFQMPEGLPTVW